MLSGQWTVFDLSRDSVTLEIRSPKSFKMNPDLESERSISYEAHFKHALLQVETG